ncbi:MAG: ABC transporter permease [Dehalococcoidia bacterium]
MAAIAERIRARVSAGIDPKTFFMGFIAAVVVYLVAMPLVVLLLGSFKVGPLALDAGRAGISNYIAAYSDPNIITPLKNSVIFAGSAALLGFAIGTTFAWLVERTNVPMKNLASALVLVPLIMPGVLFAISWLFLLSPNIGLINVIIKAIFGLEEAPFNIHSLGGMIWLEGLVMAPLVFILMSASFRSMDPSLEEAASVSGAGILTTARRITFKLMLPAVISVLLIIFVRGMEAFEIPAILGIPSGIMVFSTKIFLALQKVPKDYGLASTLGVSMIVLSAVGVLIYHRLTARAYRFATVTGKGYRPRVIDLGRWRYAAAGAFIAYFLLTVGLPFFILLWGSLLPYYSVPSVDRFADMSLINYKEAWQYPNATRAIRNTLLLATSAATAIVLISAVISWIVVRTRTAGRQILDILAFMPIAIPGIVAGLAVMWAYLTFMDWMPVYGTIWILIIAYTAKYMPYGTRATNAGLLQIHKELEEVAETSGASWWRTFTKVTLPLLLPALISAWVYIFMVSVRSLGEAILLYTSKSEVISVLIYDMREGGESNVLAALGVMVITFMVAVIFTVRSLGGRVGTHRI